MATKLPGTPIRPCHVSANRTMMQRMRCSREISATHFKRWGYAGRERIVAGSRRGLAIRVEDGSSSAAVADEGQGAGVVPECRSPAEIKEALYHSLQGINRGIFGVASARKTEIEGLVNSLESCNPNPEPTGDLEKGKALNTVNFQVKGLKLLKGQLTIVANFKVTSPTRVEIEYQDSTIAPEQV
ncbi:putative plastid-lipid-associated protein 7 [Nymphaea thermarum]|nr:putative plastid-lipid-associated protein 7 [Nymphaea thermarum]